MLVNLYFNFYNNNSLLLVIIVVRKWLLNYDSFLCFKLVVVKTNDVNTFFDII